MKLTDITNVLTFAAFRAEPDDGTVLWSKRFPNQRSLLLNFGRDSVTWRGVSKSGVLGENGSMTGEIKDLVRDMADEWQDLTDGGWCAVSVNNRFVISLESNLTRKEGAHELIRSNPKAALGSKAERGKRYALKHNAESNSSLLLAVDEDYVKEIEALLSGSGLKVGRVSCGIFGMLCEAIDQVAEARQEYNQSKPKEALGNIVTVVCCEGSVCVLNSDQERWLELRSRSGLYKSDDLDPVCKIIRPILESVETNAQIVFNSDQSGKDVKELLNSLAPGVRINDISQSAGFWDLLKER